MVKEALKGFAIAASAAALFACGSDGTDTGQQQQSVVKCQGINDCAGQGACAGEGHDCAGLNDCAGQGYVEVDTTDECEEAGGTVIS